MRSRTTYATGGVAEVVVEVVAEVVVGDVVVVGVAPPSNRSAVAMSLSSFTGLMK